MSTNKPVCKTEPKESEHGSEDLVNVKMEKTDVKNEPLEAQASNEPSGEKTIATTSNTPKKDVPAANAPPKRTFVPNLGIQRVKKETPTEEEKSKEGRKPHVPNLSKSAQRGGRANRNQQNVIQTHSVFEAGPGQSVRRFGSDRDINEGYGRVVGLSSGSGGGGSGGDRSIKKERDVDGARSLQKLEDEAFIEKYEELKSPVFIQLKHDVKEEQNEQNIKQTKPQESKEDKTLRDLFDPIDQDNNRKKLLLFQIPETLQLNELEEGQIGKIIIRKSGKIEFCVNNEKYFNISLSVGGSFLQDAVALELNDETVKSDEIGGKMSNLGHVENKIIVSHRF